MVTIKSKDEIKQMEYACQIVAKIHQELKKNIVVGCNGLKLDKIASKIIYDNNCESNFKGYYGFPNTICVSINNELVHGIPDHRIFKSGDLVSVDAGCKFNGYHADAAFTVIVEPENNPKYLKLLQVTENSLLKAIDILKPGIRIGQISNVIQKYVESEGYYLPKDYTGHGIGYEMHEDPSIPNWGNKKSGIKLREGMVICIEPMVQIGTDKTKVLSNGWTVVSTNGSYSAHFEHTIAITKDGSKILSQLRGN